MQYSTTFCFSFARSFPILLLLLLCHGNPSAFAHGCCASALPIPPPSLAVFRFCFFANPCAFTRSFPLETHTKFLRRKTFVQYSGLDSLLEPWTRCLVAIAQNSFSAQQHFFKFEECARCRGHKAKTTGAYLSTRLRMNCSGRGRLRTIQT